MSRSRTGAQGRRRQRDAAPPGRRRQDPDLVWEASEELAAEHLQAFQAAMQAYHAGDSESAEQRWQELRAIWSRAWAANYAALELLQNAGITTFSPVKPQRWVIASFEHHGGPHGLPHPHVHNIVITRLTTADHIKPT